MKKNTKASKKRLNNLLIILLLTAVLLIMSTYAWFTSNRTVFVQGLNLKVATSSGLQISADGKNWKTILTAQDIEEAAQNYSDVLIDQIPTLMAPVSSGLEVDANGHLKMFFGDVQTDLDETSDTYGRYLLTSTLDTDINSTTVTTTGDYDKGHYMAFDIFLKVDAESPDLYMSGSVVDPDNTNKGIEYSTRVALIKGNTETDTTNDTAVRNLSTVGGQAILWEPNYDMHTVNGVANAVNLGWNTNLSAGSGNPYINYDGVKGEVSNVLLEEALQANDSTNFVTLDKDTMNNYWATTQAEKPDMKISDALGALSAGATKFRVYLWVEGQDVDCENSASGTNVEYNFRFSLDSFMGQSTTDGETTDP